MAAPYLPLPRADAGAISRSIRAAAGPLAPSMRRPRWEVEGRAWPNREASSFVQAAGLRWHVQRMGQGPELLLIHGTGAATHSWRGLAPLLARHFTILAPDLPGHGFTDPLPGHRLSLPGMAQALGWIARQARILSHDRGRPFRRRCDPRPDVHRPPDRAADAGVAERRFPAVPGSPRPPLHAAGEASGHQPAGAARLLLDRRLPSGRTADPEHRLGPRQGGDRPLRPADPLPRPCLRRTRHDGELGPAPAGPRPPPP